jgi:Xaa-Pro aminopeptidase
MRQPHHIQERIDRLRAAMREHGLVAWIVLSSDPHLSEYLPGRWQGREWLSGFTGSVGSLVVTVDFAGLWVDSRYWLQADSQLAGTGIATMRAQANAGVAFIDWLAERCGPKDRVGVDGRCLGLSVSRMLRDALYAKDAELVAGLDLLDSVWEGRPGLPSEAVFEQQAAFAPVPRAGKLRDLRQTMRSAHAAWHLISSLDDIAWVLNLRGNDVPYNPVFVAHLLFDPDGATLFISAGKVDGALRARLAADGVALASRSWSTRAVSPRACSMRWAPACAASNRSTRRRWPRRSRPRPKSPSSAARWSRTARRWPSSSPGSSRPWRPARP